ncbi:MAG: hypothetical protein ACHQRJ_02125 [Alphaproteobacteria bacterium]
MIELYAAAVAYIALHIAAYLAILRWLPRFKRERTIFLYHAISGCVFSAGALLPGVLAASSRLLIAGVGLVMLHGLYSIIFLELWSLSQISYSIAILAEVKRHGAVPVEALVQELIGMGEAKKAVRLESLDGLGLVGFDGARYQLTDKGRLVAALIRTVRWLANFEDTG